jgi:hypothetical protein
LQRLQPIRSCYQQLHRNEGGDRADRGRYDAVSVKGGPRVYTTGGWLADEITVSSINV